MDVTRRLRVGVWGMTSERHDPTNDYVRRVESMPPLAPQQERALWNAIERGDDPDAARKRLIEAYLHVVVPIAREHQGHGLDLADLIEEGNIGLVRAIELFEPSEGRDFASFASRTIEDAIETAVG